MEQKTPPHNTSHEPGSGAPDCQLKEVLDLISAQLNTRGKIPDNLPGSPEDQIQLRSILDTLNTTRNHLTEISEGNFDVSITLRGPFGGALKNLQSHLRHLTWKTRAIAK